MLFNSLEFPLFFLTVVIIYFSLPHRYRWSLLLVASYYFYMCWKPEYVLLIIISTLVDYFLAIKMSKVPQKAARKPYLYLSLTVNLGILGLFKYLNFFGDSVRVFLGQFNISNDIPYFHMLLPVGISFYTFQTLSYTIDVYRGYREPERHLGIFAVYVSYFPQLVAGPIERSTHLLPQFRKFNTVSDQRIASGLLLMMWGFFKKVVISDRLAMIVDTVYGHPESYNGLPLLLATYAFAFQIYCDFSGYSDIAIGGARVMGYDLMKNFNRPYHATSIREFWQRWHISLSTWFRDYVYIPLGGSKVSAIRRDSNIIIVFVLSGLWHGAGWNFVVWGLIHGFFLVLLIWSKHLRDIAKQFTTSIKVSSLYKLFCIMFTFHIVCFGWILFRAEDLTTANYIMLNIFVGIPDQLFQLPKWDWLGNVVGTIDLGINRYDFLVACAALLVLETVHILQYRVNIGEFIATKPKWFRWSTYIGLIVTIVLFGVDGSNQFIYFQF